ncbi:Alkaline phosphatase synthesis sensor protein PhoR [Leptolyngbya sp. O-77]|nr:Alkaline phosphatase synthesis sensor protein PhoR [Leptolyngbya sp. O-77]
MGLKRQLGQLTGFPLRRRSILGLLILLVASYLGNLARWNLFFNIDLIFGSIAVWLVVGFYGVRWGVLAGALSGACTYFLWGHPYAGMVFTLEALFVGFLFYHSCSASRPNLVLLNGLFWLLIGVPLGWFFYDKVLQIDPVQVQIILLKQPVNGIFNALIASLLMIYLPIHRWIDRPKALNSLALQQALFNLLVAFVFLPTLLLIMFASRDVIDTIRSDAQADLSRVSGHAVASLRLWHQEHLQSASELALQVAKYGESDQEHLQHHLESSQRLLPDLHRVQVWDREGRVIVSSDTMSDGESDVAIALRQEDIRLARQTLQPILSDVIPGALPRVVWSVPIVQRLRLEGLILSEVGLGRVETLLRQSLSGEGMDLTLVGRNQTVVLSTRGDRPPGSRFQQPQDSIVEPLGDNFYQVFPERSRPIMARWMNSWFGQAVPVAAGLPWTLVAEASAQSDVRNIQRIYSRNLALLLAIALLALLVSALVSQRMVRPLSRLAQVTTNLPDKLLAGQPIDWPDSQITELAFLVKNFRTMGKTLTQQFGAIQQALSYEALVRRITDSVRDSLDESQILQTAVQALGQELNLLCCDAALYSADQKYSTIQYEYTIALPSALGTSFAIPNEFSEVHGLLLRGESCQFCAALPHPVRPTACMMTVLAHPIWDDQGVLGDLWLFKPQGECFEEPEVRLVQQVASQCAIALRQARLYEAAQIQLKALEDLNLLKDDFLSTVSHELRTPITNIKMAINMLKLSQQNERREQYLKILEAECEREANLINDLLDLQRLASGTQALELEPISLQDWVLHIVESFQERIRNRQQTLQIEISDKLPVITSDPACLERILTELLNNACKYTPPGEKIRVAACAVGLFDCEAAVMTETTAETTAETIAKTTGGDRPFALKPFSAAPNLDSAQNFASLPSPNPGFFVLRVCNSGVEIPAEALEHIFEKFYRVPGIDRWKQGGTGLGLALVQKMTEHLGGSIQVASAARQTCFTVALPVSPPHQTAPQSTV